MTVSLDGTLGHIVLAIGGACLGDTEIFELTIFPLFQESRRDNVERPVVGSR
jgi:hypothetical protein